MVYSTAPIDWTTDSDNETFETDRCLSLESSLDVGFVSDTVIVCFHFIYAYTRESESSQKNKIQRVATKKKKK